jgi:hypothetical protein
MMYGFEYALHADVITVAAFGVAPREDINGAAPLASSPLKNLAMAMAS